MRNRPVYDVIALLARCGIGVVFLAHGWQKIQVGVTATGRTFDAMNVPLPTAAAVYSTFVELLGGAALIVGAGLPIAGTLLFLDMAGAFVFVHARHGILLVDQGRVRNGFELVLVLGTAALLIAAGGGGRLSLDHRMSGRRKPGPARGDAGERPGRDGPRPGEGERRPGGGGGLRGLARGGRSGRPASGDPRPEPVGDPRPDGAGEEATAAKGRVPSTRRPSAGKESPSPAASETAPIPAPPGATAAPAAPPRLAADIVRGTSRDVRVAGGPPPAGKEPKEPRTKRPGRKKPGGGPATGTADRPPATDDDQEEPPGTGS